jgi:ribonuclease R
LRELEDEGLIERDRKMLRRPGTLPAVTVLEITMRDSDGDLIARPAEWLEDHGAAAQGDGAPVQCRTRQGAASPHSPSIAARIGDKVLARIFASPHGKGMIATPRGS